MVFQWRCSKWSVDANVAGEVLSGIEREHGSVLPKEVVEVSRSEDAPLHNCFEWDDGVAAERYREEQAKDIIRNLVVIVDEITDNSLEPVRAFLSVHEIPNESRKYLSVARVFRDSSLVTQVIEQALKELESFERKYSNLIQFSDIMEAIRKVRANI